MSISTIEIQPTLAERISIDEETLTVDFIDGRSISVPLEWYPRLLHGTPKSAIVGDSSVKVKAFIGLNWMRIVASKMSGPANLQERFNVP